ADLETKLKETQTHRCRMIATDGVFSMDGTIANLKEICALAEKYAALVMVDECHAAGFIGRTGRGTPEHHGVMQRIDVITGTLGKALGGGSGGYATGRKTIIELLRQRSRPYLFSNSLTPCTVAASIKAIEIASRSTELRDRLEHNTRFFRDGLAANGLAISSGTHPIVPVMIGDAALSQTVANRLLSLGVYVIGFFYPVVPQGTARIRTQVSAAHSKEDLQFAIEQFATVRQEYDLREPFESRRG
ncbi:MAG TPA: aminotransferase class I/II-fold pyridoxal phosphate-dependent enzyme, partial [Chthoniobacterales bacterium]|nr:aminotransferase class I/II-fold pyridoxal phosphate-dependent enzyme [Chthoniobacterales bacterium]